MDPGKNLIENQKYPKVEPKDIGNIMLPYAFLGVSQKYDRSGQMFPNLCIIRANQKLSPVGKDAVKYKGKYYIQKAILLSFAAGIE